MEHLNILDKRDLIINEDCLYMPAQSDLLLARKRLNRVGLPPKKDKNAPNYSKGNVKINEIQFHGADLKFGNTVDKLASEIKDFRKTMTADEKKKY